MVPMNEGAFVLDGRSDCLLESLDQGLLERPRFPGCWEEVWILEIGVGFFGCNRWVVGEWVEGRAGVAGRGGGGKLEVG